MHVRIAAHRPFLVTFSALIALTWATLIGWGVSPYGWMLDHHATDEAASFGVPLVAIAVTGWVLMTIAMMLPTSMPLIALFVGLTRYRPDHRVLVGLVVIGYLQLWVMVGLAIHLLDLVVHAAVGRITWLGDHTGLLGAATLMLAGVYQFSRLKYHCLAKCRSPLGFIMGRWRGRRDRLQAFRLGLDHGLFCIGCCWTLMLLMFAVGVGNIGWMLLLAVVMAVEKNVSWGQRISKPLGGLLLGAGLALLVTALQS